jgi:hypothetical protein
MSAARQAAQLRELLGRLARDPGLRAHLDVALRAAEAGPPEPTREARTARMVEATLTPEELAEVLGHRYAHDPDGFIAAWRAAMR